MRTVPLVETTRGLAPGRAISENIHQGAIAVVDRHGRVLFSAGDPHTVCFTRSTLKPIQVLPLLLSGGLSQFGFGAAELALMCASHSGEPQHVAGVDRILTTVGCNETDLGCGCHVPLVFAACGEEPPAQAQWSQLHNNCSGKHSGFLAWCRLHGVPVAGYLEFDHPLQSAIRELVAQIAGCDAEQLNAGLDGCSAPNYALPLARLAQTYARLAQGEADPQFGVAFRSIFEAMTQYPELVSGRCRSDLAYMRCAPGDWVSKAGADGLQVLGSSRAGLGIAIKIADGNARAAQVAMIEVLNQLGLLQERPLDRLQAWRRPEIRNCRGSQTGAVAPVFELVKGRD